MTKTAKTATCTRCKATLRSAASIARGMGAHCERVARREAVVVAAGFKPAAIEKARQLIADRAIVPLRGRRVFHVVASNGTDRYLTAPNTCNCPAGLRAKHACYHRAAAAMLAA
ncbi:hypothetical protein [Spirillospora sp. CA-294931]|uniref:hypothetical protein n=1 Tax=Spirillospora sp. CA-294931 TaxID=3240042 RepID=UPI003D942528